MTSSEARYRQGRTLAPLALGMFARALQLTVIAPSLIEMSLSLRSGVTGLGWVLAGYATGSLIAQPIAGRLSDAVGRKRIFMAAIGLFAIGSLIGALSTSLGALIAGRIVQSLGAGAVAPAATAIIGDEVPERSQGAALGLIYGAFALAAAIGAVLGGALVDWGVHLGLPYPWHLIFWVNIPLAIITLALGLRLPADRGSGQRVGFDIGGIACIAGFAACLMVAAYPLSSGLPSRVLWLLGAAGCVVALFLWERRATDPLIDPSLLASRGSALVYAIAFLSGVSIFSVTMYGATYYMAQFHASAAQGGIALLFLAVPLGIGQALGGKLVNRFGPKTVLFGALLTLAFGLGLIALRADVAAVRAAFALCGLGMGLGTAPPNVMIYRFVDASRRGAATGLLTMFASSGAITAPALVTASLIGFDAGADFRGAYAFAFAIALACLPLAAVLPEAG